jgi:hypothetical protein
MKTECRFPSREQPTKILPINTHPFATLEIETQFWLHNILKKPPSRWLFSCPQPQSLDDFSDKSFRKTTLMLGTVHILMIRHGLYRSLPRREGGGGKGNVTNPKQELRRQFRFVRRHTDLIGDLARIRAGLPIDPDTASRLRRCRLRLRAAHSAAKAQELQGITSTSVTLSNAKSGIPPTPALPPHRWPTSRRDVGLSQVDRDSSREATKGSEPNETRRRRLCLGRRVPARGL